MTALEALRLDAGPEPGNTRPAAATPLQPINNMRANRSCRHETV